MSDDIKQAQAALDGFKHISCETTAIEWFEKYAGNINFNKNIVKKALKAYIEREQGCSETSLLSEGVWIVEDACISGTTFIEAVFTNEKEAQDFADAEGYPIVNNWKLGTPTPTEQEEV